MSKSYFELNAVLETLIFVTEKNEYVVYFAFVSKADLSNDMKIVTC